jgi:hypothetical protein
MSSKNTDGECSLAGASRYGVLMRGLPVTNKYDKLLGHLSKDPCSTRIWGRTKPIKTELLYEDGGEVKKTTGEAIFIFEEHHEEENLARYTNGIRLDKNHTLGTQVIRVCKTCHSDIYGQTDDGGALHTASMVDPDSCRTCVPDQFCCCCKEVMSEEVGDIYSKYVSCQPCRENIEEQEKWRLSIPILDTESRFKETKYLCDEAIIREQELMGGKAPVSEDWVSPFMITYCTDLLVDPTSGNYWPYGMSGRDYVSLQDLRRFNNPMSETPDSSWVDIEVTGEIIQDYWTRMKSLQDKFNFKSLKDPGSLPTTLSKKEKSYRLVPDTHGFTCDDPTCQAMFQQQNELDGGAYAALIITGLPIYTSREGDLTCESVSELGYGYEYCLACLMK